MWKCSFGAYADNKCPDQTEHTLSLIWAFNVRLQYHWILKLFYLILSFKVISSRILQNIPIYSKKGKRKVQGAPQSQTAALPRPQEEEETDKSKQAQTDQTYEKH